MGEPDKAHRESAKITANKKTGYAVQIGLYTNSSRLQISRNPGSAHT